MTRAPYPGQVDYPTWKTPYGRGPYDLHRPHRARLAATFLDRATPQAAAADHGGAYCEWQRRTGHMRAAPEPVTKRRHDMRRLITWLFPDREPGPAGDDRLIFGLCDRWGHPDPAPEVVWLFRARVDHAQLAEPETGPEAGQ